MKTTRLLHFLTRKLYYLPFLFLFAAGMSAGCKKSTASNPCDGVLNEGMPTQVGLILVDKQTGENILLAKNIDTATITITPAPPDFYFKRGLIVKETGAPMYGALIFPVVDTKEGAFKYKIDIPDVGSFTLSYTNKDVIADNECKTHYISITDPGIEDHEFTLSRTAFRFVFTVKM